MLSKSFQTVEQTWVSFECAGLKFSPKWFNFRKIWQLLEEIIQRGFYQASAKNFAREEDLQYSAD